MAPKRRVRSGAARAGGFSMRNVVKTGLRLASAYSRSRSYTKRTPKKSVETGGVTFQHDRRLLYKKKNMPVAKKQAWKQFKSKVNAVEIANRGLTSRVFNSTQALLVGATSQNWIAAHLYGINGTASAQEIGENDMAYAVDGDDNLKRTITAAAAGGPKQTSAQFSDAMRMQSATLDTIFTNDGPNAIIVDVYHLWYSKPESNALTNLAQIFGYATSNTQQVTQAGVNLGGAPAITNFGTSVFDLSKVMASGGVKIMSVKQYVLASGQIMTDQIRDSKNYSINPTYVRGYAKHSIPKYTETLLYVIKNPGFTDNSISLRATRHYRYSVEGLATDVSNYEFVA